VAGCWDRDGRGVKDGVWAWRGEWWLVAVEVEVLIGEGGGAVTESSGSKATWASHERRGVVGVVLGDTVAESLPPLLFSNPEMSIMRNAGDERTEGEAISALDG